ncbi:MAG TPA: HAMP domain-containing sensor histidine kinase [Acidimicrobiales bacterium]
MTRRLLLSYLGLAILILVVLEVPLGLLAQRHERGISASQASREAAGLAGLATEGLEHTEAAQLSNLATTYKSSTGGEVEIIGPAGNILASSSSDKDNDVVTDFHQLVVTALYGVSASAFTEDEGKPWAAAVTPVLLDRRPAGVVLLAIPASVTEQRIHDIWIALGGFAAAVLVLTAVVGVVLARSLSRPLSRLESVVAGLGGGDLNARARENDGPPQIRSLAQQFNHMASRLTELVESQARFVADASHQLRSPLTALRLRLENLEASATSGTTDEIAAAGREVQRLSRIVDGLLTISRAGQDEPPREVVDIQAVIAERCDAWGALAAEKHVALDHNGPGPLFATLVPGDLEQILDNLLANALDASPQGSRIVVSVDSDRSRSLRVHVTDEGRGMTLDERNRAFDRFWQGPTSNGGHSGLGLAIVRQLANCNGASVELRQAYPTGLDVALSVVAAQTEPAVARR